MLGCCCVNELVLVLFIDGSVGCNSGSRLLSDEIQRESVAVGGDVADDALFGILGFGGTSVKNAR